jgi:hypothetical protein
MKRARVWGSAVFVAATAALVAPMAASAALPTPNHAKIVPFKSIGPIGFGTTKAQAFSKWGSTSQCAVGTGGRDTCVWSSTSSSDYPEQSAVLELVNGKVCGMLIRAGTNSNSGELTITRLKKWKTDEGVGLGSKLRAAKQVLGGKLVAKKHHVTTAFTGGYTTASQHQVEELTIYKDGCNVT